MESAHAHCSNWPAKLTAPLAGSAENDPKKCHVWNNAKTSAKESYVLFSSRVTLPFMQDNGLGIIL